MCLRTFLNWRLVRQDALLAPFAAAYIPRFFALNNVSAVAHTASRPGTFEIDKITEVQSSCTRCVQGLVAFGSCIHTPLKRLWHSKMFHDAFGEMIAFYGSARCKRNEDIQQFFTHCA